MNEERYLEIINALLEKGADPNLTPLWALTSHVRTEKGRTPLYWAATKGLPRVVELLLSKGADVNVRTVRLPCGRRR